MRQYGLNLMANAYMAEQSWEAAAQVIDYLQRLHGQKLQQKSEVVARRLPEEMRWMAPNLANAYDAMRQAEGASPAAQAPRPRPLHEQILDRRVSNRDALKAAFNDAWRRHPGGRSHVRPWLLSLGAGGRRHHLLALLPVRDGGALVRPAPAGP